MPGTASRARRFRYLAANVIDRRTGEPIFPAYGIKTFDGVKIGFIGLTLKGTDQIVDPKGIAGVEFRDEATTINARAAELKAQGVHALVVLIHEGGYSKQRFGERACPGLTGDILPILDRLDPDIDVVASAHTHQAYVCTYRGFLLTSAASYGRLVTDIDLDIDRTTGRVLTKSARNVIVTSAGTADQPQQAGYAPVEPDRGIAALAERYAALAAPLANRRIGTVTGRLSNREDADGQSPLGAVLADADLEATRAAGARIGLLNPGSVRAPIDPVDGGGVTYGATVPHRAVRQQPRDDDDERRAAQGRARAAMAADASAAADPAGVATASRTATTRRGRWARGCSPRR